MKWFVIDTVLREKANFQDATPATPEEIAAIARSPTAARNVSCHTFGCDYKRPYVIVRLPFNHLRFEFLLNPDENPTEILCMNAEEEIP